MSRTEYQQEGLWKPRKKGSEREALREKGQFWTPRWVARAMVQYVIAGGNDEIFDPAVGEGAFFRAAKDIGTESGKKLALLGTEIDPAVIEVAKTTGLEREDFLQVKICDFVLDPPKRKFAAIVANPPYIRHHRLRPETKKTLRDFGRAEIGQPLDGRAGLHIYFLLRALKLLNNDGRLAFIMPADTCEGVFAGPLWTWITRNYRLDAIVTFSPEASPFPKVDVNPLIILIRNTCPLRSFYWARCTRAETSNLEKWILSHFRYAQETIEVHERTLVEGLRDGLSRPPNHNAACRTHLGDLAKVMRGVATGANDFFFMTQKRAHQLGIPNEFLVPAIGRTRDVDGDTVSFETLNTLERRQRPTMLFSPDGRPIELFPEKVQEYLKQGERSGINKRALILTRNPWYKMEKRPPPPFLFAYLGRRNTRFIRNLAGVVPLTGFLCVYPHQEDPENLRMLSVILRHPDTLSNLSLVGKSYGSGAIKIEPRALESLPIPDSALSEASMKLGVY